jgi:hypothetical protein
MPLTDRLSASVQPAGTSFPDRLMIWLHVAFVIFTIGPVTIATLFSPRYIRTRNVAVLRYMLRTTRIFGFASLGVLAFGIAAAQGLHKLSAPWITTAMTLFVVSFVLLLLIMRDQRRAVVALETAGEADALATANSAPSGDGQDRKNGPDDAPGVQALPAAANAHHPASVERGRIASLAGIVTLIWLVILVLMVWNS